MAKKIKLLSKAEYAKYKGWGKPYITKLHQKGLIVEVDGKIDIAATDKRISEAQDPARDPFRKQVKGSSKAVTAKKPVKASKDTSDLSYHDARTLRERIKAKKEQVEYDLLIGKLVDSEDVKIAAFNRGRALRDSILNIPDRISPILAAETDTRKVHQILFKELRTALEGQSNVKC